MNGLPLAFGDDKNFGQGAVNTSVVVGQTASSGVQKKQLHLKSGAFPTPNSGATIVKNQLESYDHEVCLICYFDTHLAPI